MNKKIGAFTLMEVISVVIIVTIIAAFSIPNYTKAILKSDERNMVTNLRVMRTAVEIYTDNGGTIGAWNSLATINNNMGIGIIDPKATYACIRNADASNQCTATHPRGWALQFNDKVSNGLLNCSIATCPSCPALPGTCG